MLVIVEGPNFSGKSTLIRAVAALRPHARILTHPPKFPAPGASSRVASREWPHAETTHAEYQALRCCDVSAVDVLVDRLWVTDRVYGDVFHRPSYDRSYVRPREDFGASVAVVHVTVLDHKTLVDRGSVGPFDPLADFLPLLHEAFVAYVDRPPENERCPVLTLYTDVGLTPEEQAVTVDRWLWSLA